MNAHAKAYRERNKATVARQHRLYKARNKKKTQEIYLRSKRKFVERERKRNRDLKHQAIVTYGGACACCGESHECFLTIDHVYNDGARHRKQRKENGGMGDSIYRYLKKAGYPKDGRFQVLCYSCNCAKYYDPAGHRAAHPNAKNIDGYGDDVPPGHNYRGNRALADEPIKLPPQRTLWGEECCYQNP